MCKPRVSIKMGVLNAENRMKEAIGSIQKQTFSDWEFIICDDGSHDNSYQILLDMSKEDPRIKPLKNECNKGLARTLNYCLQMSQGEYIARMDDDDFSYPNRLQIQVDFLSKNLDYDFISSAVDVYDGKRIIYKDVKKEFPQKEDFAWNSPFVHPAAMFRGMKLKEVGGYRFARETRRAEDYDLFMRMYSKNMQGYNSTESLLRYYVSQEAMKKRKYRYRIDEMVVRYKGFKLLGLLPKKTVYVIKPLLVGLIPNNMLIKYNKSRNE